MDKFSITAKAYIVATIGAGAVLVGWQLTQLRSTDLKLALVVGALAAVAQVLKVDGPTERSSYNTSWVAYGFALVLLGAPAATLVVLVSHVAEWIKNRYPWYIQSFNIGSYAIVVSAAGLAYTWLSPAQPPTGLLGLAAVVGAAGVFTWVNHISIGLVLKLARRQSFTESGVFERLTLAIDFTLFGMGEAAALIWLLNPYAALLAAVPLYLIYTTLKIPALQRQTQTDPKTGLYNSPYFAKALEQELARADRYDRPLTVVMADLDLLRNINNTYGHLAGDTALVSVASILKKMVREYDVVARFGGEEFALLMPETSPDQVQPHVDAIRAAIAEAQIEVSTSVTPLRVTMSFGIAGRERFGQTPNEIIHCADLAVYQAKLSGRNRICCYAAGGVQYPETVAPLAAEPAAQAFAPPPASVSTTPAQQPAASAPKAEAPAGPTLQPRPLWAVNAYIAGVALAALGLLAILWRPTLAMDGWGLTLFAVMVFLAEWLALDIYVRDTSVSTATAPLIAGIILFGSSGAVALSLAVAAAAWLKHRSPLSRFIFNTANHLISSLLCAAVFALPAFRHGPLLLTVAFAMLAAGLSYLSSSGLVALGMNVSSGQRIRQIWEERFRWLWPYYLAMGLLASALAAGYKGYGLVGLMVTLVPLLILRFSQAQSIDRTKALVSQLRASNAELQQRADEISTLNEELLLALSHAIDLRDPDVEGHSQNVARYAVLMAQELGLPPERVELIRKAGLLHDIGKLGIRESILFKPATLTVHEYDIVKTHASLGAEVVDNCQSLKALVPFIRHHHERFDGRGYPDGLSGHDIPLEARVLGVADAMEAMASDRPYRRGQNAEQILKEIRSNSGTQFDPMVVNAFVRMTQRQGASVIVNSARPALGPQPEVSASVRQFELMLAPAAPVPNPSSYR